MILYKRSIDIHDYLDKLKREKNSIGFVPTMGALHDGHIALVQESLRTCDITVVSIFVNPTQFDNKEDFSKYPNTIEHDIYLLEKSGCDVLFQPTHDEVYPGLETQAKTYDLGYLDEILEGKFRKGHFQGVCQVVEWLLKIVQPTHLFLGQKDYQQVLVIKKLLDISGSDITLVRCPTYREPDGLAMSSRNLRLNKDQRVLSAEIYKCLCYMKTHLMRGDLSELQAESVQYLKAKDFTVDYVEIAEANDLKNVPDGEWDGIQPLVALIAASIGDIRLIDNLLLTDI